MEKCYIYGAGINGNALIQYLGHEKIIAAIDASLSLQGTELSNVKVISFETFWNQYKGEKIIVSVIHGRTEVIKKLNEYNISNFILAPDMLSGMWNRENLIGKFRLNQNKRIFVVNDNPIIQLLYEDLPCLIERFNSIEEIEEYSEVNCDLILGMWIEQKTQKLKRVPIIDLAQDVKGLNDYSYLKKFRNIHEGERCFIIGNGPSLRADDLEKIHNAGIKSIACNNIGKIYEATSWRPSFYMIIDHIVFDKLKDDIPDDIPVFLRDTPSTYLVKKENVFLFSQILTREGEEKRFSEDICKGTISGRTTTYTMMQLMAYMGFKELVLLGVDFSWGEKGKETHFYKIDDKCTSDSLVRERASEREYILDAYMAAAKFAENKGIKILNATRGGCLEVFERVDFDKLFED